MWWAIGLLGLTIIYMFLRAIAVSQLQHVRPDLYERLGKPTLTARIGNESFTNFVLFGRYRKKSFTKSLMYLCLVLQLIVITFISVLAVAPLLYGIVKLVEML